LEKVQAVHLCQDAKFLARAEREGCKGLRGCKGILLGKATQPFSRLAPRGGEGRGTSSFLPESCHYHRSITTSSEKQRPPSFEVSSWE
jgi:hypothetical protein